MVDNVSPTLTSLILPSIDLSSGSSAFSFTIGAQDDSTGVASAIIWLDRRLAQEINGQSNSIESISFSGAQDSFSDGLSTETRTISAFSNPGLYTIRELVLFDKADNQTSYLTSELTAKGFQTSFSVSGTKQDTFSPTIKSLSTPSVVDLSKGPANATFTLGALDTGTGVDFAAVWFDKPITYVDPYGNTIQAGTMHFSDGQDSFSDGLSSTSLRLSPLTNAGTYTIREIAVLDKAGNRHAYSTAELAALGAQTSFIVTGGTNDHASPVMTSFSATGKVDLLNGNATSTFTLGAFDEGAGVSYAAIWLDKPIIQVVNGQLVRTQAFQIGHEDSFSDGVSSVNFEISALTNLGTYTITEVRLIDKAGNATTYSSADLVRKGIQNSFVISEDRTLRGSTNNDVLIGGRGDDILAGGGGRDTVKGEAGNDHIFGGTGNDILTGGAGRDAFVFDTKLNKATNVDKITDFRSVDDSFHLNNAILKKVGSNGKLKADAFIIGDKAKDAEDKIIYDKAKGALYYDADGIGSSAQIKIATLSNKAKLVLSDFLVI